MKKGVYSKKSLDTSLQNYFDLISMKPVGELPKMHTAAITEYSFLIKKPAFILCNNETINYEG